MEKKKLVDSKILRDNFLKKWTLYFFLIIIENLF